MKPTLTFSFKNFSIILLVIGVFSHLKAQVTVDAVSTAVTGAAVNTNSLTWSHTVSGTNKLLIVTCAADGGTVTGVTYGGVALTKSDAISSTSLTRSEIWYLLNPASGTANIVWSHSSNEGLVGCGISFNGVNQTTPLGTAVTGAATATSSTLSPTAADGDMVVDVISTNGDAVTTGIGQTQRYNVGASGFVAGATSTELEECPGTATNMSWTFAASDPFAHVAVPIKAITTISPITITTADAGPATMELCGANTGTMAGNALGAGETGLWTSSTGVTFTDATNPTTAFANATVNGESATWTITKGGCTTSDNVTINEGNTTVGGTASVSTTSVCTGGTVNLSLASETAGRSYQWQQNIDGGGWNNIGSATTDPYTTGALTNPNSYQFRCIVTEAATGCNATSVATASVAPSAAATVADAGTDQNVCGATVATLAGNTPVVGTGLWTRTSGGGTVTAPGTSTTNGVTGLTATPGVFRWTITNGACSSFDEVTITRGTAPTVSAAGTDQEVCATTATLAGNNPTSGVGAWSLVSGSGTITNSALRTSGLTALGSGANVFRWTITDATCTSNNTSTDDVTITNNTTTTSAAGSDQTVCATTATMAANNPAIGTGAWSLVSGSGTITTPSSRTSGLTALGAGANTFRWTITQGICTSTDDVVITNNLASGGTASATNCATSSSLSLSGEAGTIQWQQNVNGGGWNNIAGATTDPYSISPLVYGSAYDFRAILTTACGTSTSTTASIAAGGAATNYTFVSPSLALSSINGNCPANYTFTQSTTAARGSAIAAGVTVTINFMAGTNATTMTSGTFNGTAIAMGTVVTTATSVTFTTPVKMDCASSSFTIVLNGITNPAWGLSGNASVSVPNISGGTDSYTTYSAAIAYNIEPFFDYTGGLVNYATANANSWCSNNLTGGRTYCYTYTYPSGTSQIEVEAIQDNSTAPGGCGSSTCYTSSGNSSGSCASAGCSNLQMFESQCTFTNNGLATGAGCPMVAGTTYSLCYTVPAGCTGMNFCPMVRCAVGACSVVPLPIELLFFKANLVGGVVKVNWATETEINNDFFTVERTPDGIFYEGFAKVNGAGNSNSIQQYNATDDEPFKGRISYYRLKQTDYDGAFKYSKWVAVQTELDNTLEIKYLLPDPINNSLQYEFSYSGSKSILVEVVDVLGKVIQSENVGYEKGDQTLKMNVPLLSKGMYILKVSDGINSEMKKFVY